MSFFSDPSRYGDRPCIVEEGGASFSYNDVSLLCVQLEKILSGEKKLVLVVCGNRHESVVAYLAVLRAGGAVMLVNAGLADELLDGIINLYQPHFIWKPVRGNDADPEHRVGGYGLYHLYNGSSPALHPSLAVLLSTSGTTGSPRFVRLTHENITSNAESIAKYLELDSDEKPVTTLPMGYSYGLSIINSHLLVGATLLLTDSSLMTKSFWTFLKGEGATSVAGVPYTYEMLQRLRFARMNLPSLRKMTQAGGKLPVELASAFAEVTHEKGIRFYIMYGQTEATARISYVPADIVNEKYDSIGRAIPGGRLYVCSDDSGKVVEPGIEGELVYEGPNVMMGYAESREDLAKGDELSGVLRTGDIGRLDGDGYAYITGRMKRIIKMFGNRINLDDLDLFIQSGGYNGVCGGSDDHLKIAVTGDADPEIIRKRVISAFKLDHRAVEVISVKELPRNSSGKILYGELFSGSPLPSGEQGRG